MCLLVGLFNSESKEAQANQSELLGWSVGNGFELIEWEKNAPTPTSGANREGKGYKYCSPVVRYPVSFNQLSSTSLHVYIRYTRQPTMQNINFVVIILLTF